MVEFIDGPAAGESLALGRIPKLLRVVRSRNGKWDALDQLDDQAKPSETIFVYERRDELGITHYHLCFRSRNKRASGIYWNAKYGVLAEQPSEAEVRETKAWQQWATDRLVLPMKGRTA
jgi:hypothetical protein